MGGRVQGDVLVKLTRPFWVLIAIWAIWMAAAADVGPPSPGAASSPATITAPSQPAERIAELRHEAFAKLLAGQFREGLRLLGKIPPGQDPRADKVRQCTAEYVELHDEAGRERKREYATAVARVKLARLAESHRPELVEAKLAEKLYDEVEALADAVTGANRMLEVSSTSRPADLAKQVGRHLDKASKPLSALGKLVKGEHGAWRQAFDASLERLRRAMGRYRRAWKGAVLPGDWHRLRLASEAVQDCMIDVGVLVSRDPLVVGLSHARDAKELSGLTDQQFLKTAWVAELIADAENRSRQIVEKGEWGDALSIYGHGGLRDLDKDNVRYEEMVKRISRHVRMESLYGRGGERAAVSVVDPYEIGPDSRVPVTLPATFQVQPATQPAPAVATTAPAAEPRWREMIQGIDAEMIRRAIGEVDGNYVDRPDYRKMGLGALDGIKVLLETRKAGAAFPALKDDPRRRRFLAGVDRQMEKLRRQGAPDHLHVVEALNGVLEINDRTVDLPAEVINMEFAVAMLGELDKFTSMIWPYEEPDFRKRTMGLFYGIGVQIRKEDGRPIEIVAPLADTPAFRAKLRAGDLILAVDGRETKTMPIRRAVKLITGKRHTKVKLTIRRPGTPKPFDVTIVRDEIHIRTVKGWRRLPSGKWDYFIDRDFSIGYVRLTQFTGDTADDLGRALRQLRNAGAKGVILDLRFNPGGLLTAAVKVADEFLRRGLIVRTKGRNIPESERSADALGEYQSGRLVVLVNQFSASAAEIVGGALKDWKRAVLVGNRTYGKGSVQRLILLQPGRRARLKLTTAYYYLPGGRCIHRYNGAKVWGVDPDIAVPVTVRQMNRMAEIRQETDLLKAVNPELLGKLLDLQLREDAQLRTALLLLRVQQAAGKS